MPKMRDTMKEAEAVAESLYPKDDPTEESEEEADDPTQESEVTDEETMRMLKESGLLAALREYARMCKG